MNLVISIIAMLQLFAARPADGNCGRRAHCTADTPHLYISVHVYQQIFVNPLGYGLLVWVIFTAIML